MVTPGDEEERDPSQHIAIIMAERQWQPGKEGVDQIVNLLTAYMSPAQDQVLAQPQRCNARACGDDVHAINRAGSEGLFQPKRLVGFPTSRGV